jgi:hypothetical protein
MLYCVMFSTSTIMLVNIWSEVFEAKHVNDRNRVSMQAKGTPDE